MRLVRRRNSGQGHLVVRCGHGELALWRQSIGTKGDTVLAAGTVGTGRTVKKAISHNGIQSTPWTGNVAVGVDSGVKVARTGRVARAVTKQARVSPNARRVHMARVTRQSTICSSQKTLTEPAVERLSIGHCTVRWFCRNKYVRFVPVTHVADGAHRADQVHAAGPFSHFMNDRTAVSHEIGDSSPSIGRFLHLFDVGNLSD